MATYGLYFEFARDRDVFQNILVPAHQMGSGLLPPTLVYREITPQYPSRVWTVRTSSAYERAALHRSGTLEEIVGREIEQLEDISGAIISMLSSPDLELTGSFPVALTTADFHEFKEGKVKVPQRVYLNVLSKRESLAFPALPVKA